MHHVALSCWDAVGATGFVAAIRQPNVLSLMSIHYNSLLDLYLFVLVLVSFTSRSCFRCRLYGHQASC